VPLIWPALIISSAAKGLALQSVAYAVLSALFIAVLYYLAVSLNERFGLYEPPAITIQKAGVYAPKAGLLGKIGFSSVEAALIRKDIRAFTRRRELLSIYIFPIIIFIIGIFNSLGVTNNGHPSSSAGPFGLFWASWIFLITGSTLAMWLGESMIGEEGQVMWRIYASPVSGKNLVRAKYFFTVFMSTIILAISSAVAVAFYHPTLRFSVVSIILGFLSILPITGAALQIGIKGADFTQTRRARMVRQEWSLLGFVVSAAIGAAVLAPTIAVYVLSAIGNTPASNFTYAITVALGAAISLAFTAVFYQINVGSANELLKKAEM